MYYAVAGDIACGIQADGLAGCGFELVAVADIAIVARAVAAAVAVAIIARDLGF